MSRTSLITNVADAVDRIDHGDTIGIGGFLTSHKPMAFVREIIRRGISDLTLVAPPTSLETDLLIGTGCVETVIAPYVGAESVAPIAPWFRHRAERGEIDVEESDGGMIVAALEAAERNLPFMPWRGGVGTSIPDLNPDVVEFDDPITGEPLTAVPAISPDVALLHTARADQYGNVQAIGDTFADGLLARASVETIVQVEEVVANDEIRRTPEQTIASAGNVESVVEVPWGSHPFSTQGHYLADTEFLSEYTDAVSAAIDGDSADWDALLDRYVYGPDSPAEYVDVVGIDRLWSLREYGGELT